MKRIAGFRVGNEKGCMNEGELRKGCSAVGAMKRMQGRSREEEGCGNVKGMKKAAQMMGGIKAAAGMEDG